MIQTLIAGRELDALIAEKVLGWKTSGQEIGAGLFVDDGKLSMFDPCEPRPYTTDISAAWQVVEKLVEIPGNYPFILMEDRYSGSYSGGKWLASFNVHVNVYDDGPLNGDSEAMNYWDGSHEISAASSAPLAICLAALKAVDK